MEARPVGKLVAGLVFAALLCWFLIPRTGPEEGDIAGRANDEAVASSEETLAVIDRGPRASLAIQSDESLTTADSGPAHVVRVSVNESTGRPLEGVIVHLVPADSIPQFVDAGKSGSSVSRHSADVMAAATRWADHVAERQGESARVVTAGEGAEFRGVPSGRYVAVFLSRTGAISIDPQPGMPVAAQRDFDADIERTVNISALAGDQVAWSGVIDHDAELGDTEVTAVFDAPVSLIGRWGGRRAAADRPLLTVRRIEMAQGASGAVDHWVTEIYQEECGPGEAFEVSGLPEGELEIELIWNGGEGEVYVVGERVSAIAGEIVDLGEIWASVEPTALRVDFRWAGRPEGLEPVLFELSSRARLRRGVWLRACLILDDSRTWTIHGLPSGSCSIDLDENPGRAPGVPELSLQRMHELRMDQDSALAVDVRVRE